MGENKIKETGQKVEETINAAKDASKLAANAASGNLVGAAKDAINFLKNEQFKKKLKRQIILVLAKFMICLMLVVCVAGAVFSIFEAVAEKMGEIFSQIGNVATSFWQWFTNDYFIDIEEEVAITLEDGTTKTQTLVDHYIEQLDSLGVSLQDLKLLGEVDYSNPELLNTPENKELMQKYLKEFIRADIISQNIHRSRFPDLINPNAPNEREVDGGVYLYRTNSEIAKGDEISLDNSEIFEMEYKEFDEFMAEQREENIDYDDVRKIYTIDENSKELLFYKVDKKETIDTSTQDNLMPVIEITLELQRVDYRSLIQGYSMPFEFLVNLCMITQNPEFVYHVARLARNTHIELVILDSVVVTTSEEEIRGDIYILPDSTQEEEEQQEVIQQYGQQVLPQQYGQQILTQQNNQQNEQQEDEQQNELYCQGTDIPLETKIVKEIISTPQLIVSKVDSWSCEMSNNYTSIINEDDNNEDSDPENLEDISIRNEQYRQTYIYKNRKRYSITTIEEHEYTPAISVDKVTKTQQFLGLLRNSTGKCYDENNVQNCVKNAVFDKNGYNVKYRIPNSTKEEDPLSKLISGEQMLYSLLELENSNLSAYNQKNQGLKEYMQYVLTFPEQDETGVFDNEEIDNIINGGQEIQSGNILYIAKQCHDFLKNNQYFYSSDANKQRGGPPSGWSTGANDGKSTGRAVPISTTNIEPQNKRYIDCSAYVSWVLYEAGYRNAGWQWSSSSLRNNPMHFEEVSKYEMLPGDIIIQDEHAEIYAGNGRSYSCGSTRSIRADTVGTNMSKIIKVFRAPE